MDASAALFVFMHEKSPNAFHMQICEGREDFDDGDENIVVYTFTCDYLLLFLILSEFFEHTRSPV
jgi:hypothetical protein